ncbi:putative myosin X [Ixodes scapularis]
MGLRSKTTQVHYYGVKVSKAGGTGGVHFLKATACTEVRDLIHLPGPLTEDAVLRTLHARFFSREYFTNVGPVLVSVNAYQDVGNPLTLRSAHASARCPQLLQVVQEAARQQAETGYPQAIILSGENGSGKTYASMLLLRQLFDVAGGGSETDAFKHLAAAFTVLRSLGSAKTAANAQSSRICVGEANDGGTAEKRRSAGLVGTARSGKAEGGRTSTAAGFWKRSGPGARLSSPLTSGTPRDTAAPGGDEPPPPPRAAGAECRSSHRRPFRAGLPSAVLWSRERFRGGWECRVLRLISGLLRGDG